MSRNAELAKQLLGQDKIRVLIAKWSPKDYSATSLMQELISSLQAKYNWPSSEPVRAEVRGPEANKSLAGSHGLGLTTMWHRDGSSCYANSFIMVWSNIAPTQFAESFEKTSEWREFSRNIGPGDAILFNNQECVHRMPFPVVEGRYFMRACFS